MSQTEVTGTCSAPGARGTKRPRDDDSTTPEQGKRKVLKYKTLMTEVKVKRGALQIKYDDQIPPGYLLVNYGHRELTEYLISLCRKNNLPVWASRSKTDDRFSDRDASRLGFHADRNGFYFPPDIVKQAEKWFEVKIKNGVVTDEPSSHKPMSKREMADRLDEIYPNITEGSRAEVLRRLDPNKGGSIAKAKNMTPYKQVELAVIAHIRHSYTDYDKNLRQGWDRFAARKLAEPEIRAKLKQWKGEDDQDEWVTDFKEAIDLTQDPIEVEEDSDEEDYAPPPVSKQPEPSLNPLTVPPHYTAPPQGPLIGPVQPFSMRAIKSTAALPPPPRVHLRPLPPANGYGRSTVDLTHSSPPQVYTRATIDLTQDHFPPHPQHWGRPLAPPIPYPTHRPVARDHGRVLWRPLQPENVRPLPPPRYDAPAPRVQLRKLGPDDPEYPRPSLEASSPPRPQRPAMYREGNAYGEILDYD